MTHIAVEKISFILEPLPSLEKLEALWRIADKSGSHSFFLSWTWIGTWLQQLPSLSSILLLKAVSQNEVVGLSFLTLKKTLIRGVFPITQAWLNSTGKETYDSIMIEHNGFACDAEWQSKLLPALVDWFETNDHGIDELILPGISEVANCDVSVENIVLDSVTSGYRTPLNQVSMEVGVESVLTRNSRQQLRRSIRAYEKDGPLSISVAHDAITATLFFSAMKEFHISSWNRRGRRHAFYHPFFEKFHRALIICGTADGGVEMAKILAGKKVIGFLYNFRRNGIIFSYQSGFDDLQSNRRPGYVCHALAIGKYAREGMRFYDFLAQPNRLKQSFGTDKYELRWRRMRKPILPFRAERILRRYVARFQKLNGEI